MGIIKTLFGIGSKNKSAMSTLEISQKLDEFLRNQIDALNIDGHHVHINAVSIGYISHIIMMITKKPIKLVDVYDAMKNVFPGGDYAISIDNAFQSSMDDIEFKEKLAALFPIAQKEFNSGSGKFLIKYTIKALEGIESMFTTTDFDPTKVDSEVKWIKQYSMDG